MTSLPAEWVDTILIPVLDKRGDHHAGFCFDLVHRDESRPWRCGCGAASYRYMQRLFGDPHDLRMTACPVCGKFYIRCCWVNCKHWLTYSEPAFELPMVLRGNSIGREQ